MREEKTVMVPVTRRSCLKARFKNGLCQACGHPHIRVGQAITRFNKGWAAWRCIYGKRRGDNTGRESVK